MNVEMTIDIFTLVFAGGTLILSWITHRENANLKRLEVAFQAKSVAFYELLDIIRDINERIDRYFILYKLDYQSDAGAFINAPYNDANKEIRDSFMKTKEDFLEVYDRNSIYISTNLDSLLKDYKIAVLEQPIVEDMMDTIRAQRDFDDYFARTSKKGVITNLIVEEMRAILSGK